MFYVKMMHCHIFNYDMMLYHLSNNSFLTNLLYLCIYQSNQKTKDSFSLFKYIEIKYLNF